MDSEPRVERPKAAGTSGHRSDRRATRMNRADAPLKQTAHSGRRSAERRHPVRGSEPTVPRSRPGTPNGALRVLRVQSREWSGRRPRERAATAVSRRATRMNRADAPLKQTAHSGRRSAERRHPVRGSEPMALCAFCAFRAASGAAEGRGNERPAKQARCARMNRRCTAEANRSLRPAFCRITLRTNGAPARGSEPMAPRRAALNRRERTSAGERRRYCCGSRALWCATICHCPPFFLNTCSRARLAGFSLPSCMVTMRARQCVRATSFVISRT
jgi:hypothetical protein